MKAIRSPHSKLHRLLAYASGALFLIGVLTPLTAIARAGQPPSDPTLTPRARAVIAQADYLHNAARIRLQRQLVELEKKVAQLRRDAQKREHSGRAVTAETQSNLERMDRDLIEARQDLHDMQVSSEGSFDRFRARLDAEFGDLRSLLSRYRAE